MSVFYRYERRHAGRINLQSDLRGARTFAFRGGLAALVVIGGGLSTGVGANGRDVALPAQATSDASFYTPNSVAALAPEIGAGPAAPADVITRSLAAARTTRSSHPTTTSRTAPAAKPSAATHASATATSSAAATTPAASTPAVTANSTFVTRSGSQLMLGGKVFRFAGANVEGLGLLGDATTPTHADIVNGLGAAKTMGDNVVRSHTLGISVGCANCLEPSLGVFNTKAFDDIDYSIYIAKQDGLKLIIPLTDNWHYSEGGKSTFTSWLGLSDENSFYTSAPVISAFETYISELLNHVNPYTGLAYKNDPTVMAWETGNELSGVSVAVGNTWTEQIAAYIKSIDKSHLVADGRLLGTQGNTVNASQLALPLVDMYTDHMYPPDITVLKTDAAAAKAAGKVYYVGEYDWRDTTPQAAATGAIGSVNGARAAQVTVATASAVDWSAQLMQGGLPLNAGSYTLTFVAQASTSWPVSIDIVEDQAPYDTFATGSVSVGTTAATETMHLTLSQPTTGLLTFNLAGAAGKISIANAALTAAGSSANLLQGGTFSQATVGGTSSPWELAVSTQGSSLATFLADLETTPGVSGDIFWQLMGSGTGDMPYEDEYSLVYPGQTPALQAAAAQLVAHAARETAGVAH